ncbi:MAG: sugar phosphate isomerase/epimerase family protein [Hyphomicrobiaceae bacterium]
MPIAVSVITDEVAPDLESGLRMALDEGLPLVDVRSIGGVNFMSLDGAQQRAAAQKIKDAGLKVGTLATPLLKWPAPGLRADHMGDQFGFDRAGRTNDQLYDDAFRAAEVLGTGNIRVFSLLKYDGFKPADLDTDYEKLIRLAERHDVIIHVENESVCNLHTVSELTAGMQHWRHPRLRALLDITNGWRVAQATVAEVETIAPFVSQSHFKDWSATRRRMVALGEGDVPFAALLPPLYAAARQRDMTFVVETHVPDEQPGATLRSVRALKRLAAAGM